MNFVALPYYFIVKINKETQENRKEKIGSIVVHHQHAHMQRNLQCGEITSIGAKANELFPEAKIGYTLIFHHFVEGESLSDSNHVGSDDTHHYYYVTASSYNGHRNETYGVWNGSEIIPHKEFVFVEPEKEEHIADVESRTEKVGSLFVFTDWTESRQEKEKKTEVLRDEIKSLSKTTMNDQLKVGIEEKEREAEKITSDINKRSYLPYNVAYANPSLGAKDIVYSLSAAALTEIEFMDKKYIVIDTKYIPATA